MAPIAHNLVGQGSVKLDAPSCQRIKRGADAPVQREEATGLAGGSGGYLGSLNDDDFDPSATQKVGPAAQEPMTPPPQITTRMTSPVDRC
jgi:hypothetical protein